MRTDIHLFIGDQEVEFSSDPKILFNFKITELSNPTITKNSWTKQITIPSTPANDDIFNHFYKLERSNFGVNFNAMLKAPFTLYINGTLVQNGYAKLDSVKVTHNTCEYAIHLYGGIGDFLYNLSYLDGDVGDTKKTLGSLIYVNDNMTTEPNLDFVINKDTVAEAWNNIEQPSSKWDIINFANCYNGIPEDFDADKVLINNRGGAAVFQKSYPGEGGVTYRPIYGGSQNPSGYSLGEMSEEMTVDETFDLRSYLLRPVVSVNRVLRACFAPVNNGGYQVKLDSHFFNDGNPYWADGKCWCTLPMLRDLEVEGGQMTEITGATISNTTKNKKVVNFNAGSLSEVNNVRLKINVGLNASEIGGSLTTLYSYYHYHSNATTVNNDYVKDYYSNDGALFMLIGRDVNGKICAKSKAYCLSSYKDNVTSNTPIWNGFKVEGYPEPDEVIFVQGKWRKIDGYWRFCNMAGNQVDIEFTFPSSSPIATLEICTQANNSEKTIFKGLLYHNKQEYTRPDISFASMWAAQEVTNSTSTTYAQILNSNYTTHYTYSATSFYAEATDYEALFSNSYIPKSRLLSTSYTPAEFLTSYCKMFGLYIYRNPSEQADDPNTCPKGVIHIYDRDTFYTDEYVDLQDRIDRSKTMTITPTLASTKWYLFDQDPIESDAGTAYSRTYGYNYGRQLVNTNYNFDNKTTKLYDGNVFKSGVMVREKDKYFALPYMGAPIYAWNGMKYSLFTEGENGWENVDIEIPTTRLINRLDINSLGHKGYDCMPKLQCHNDDNTGGDGAGVLLFYTGKIETINDYWLTDDVLEMQTLNGNACWLIPGSGIDAIGNQIGIKVNELPFFTRDLINFGLQEGYIVNSWNFGHPQVTFSPNTYTTSGDSIYDKCWKEYISDLYDQDSKQLSCYVNFLGIPDTDYLRKFWWFDNCVWVLWEIKDFNLADPTSILCTFVRVKDVNNYKLTQITDAGIQNIVLNSNRVPYTGGTITGQILLQSGGQWFSEGSSGVVYGDDVQGNRYNVQGALRPYTGQGQTTNIQVVFPQSSASTEISWTVQVRDGMGNRFSAQVVQEGDTSPYIDFASDSKELTAGVSGGTYVLYYVSQNVTPSSVSVTSDAQWITAITVNTTNKSITLGVSPSTMPYQRTANLTINALGINGAVVNNATHFYQQGGAIDVWPSSLTFDYNSSSGKTITVDTDIQWTAEINDN